MQEALAKSNELILERIIELLDSDNQSVQQNCVALLALLARIEGASHIKGIVIIAHNKAKKNPSKNPL